MIVDLYSMAPWRRIALNVEQLRISQAQRAIAGHPELTEVRAHVNELFFLESSFQFQPNYQE